MNVDFIGTNSDKYFTSRIVVVCKFGACYYRNVTPE
jgi:hypothetical protein